MYSSIIILPCEIKRQQLRTFQVSRHCVWFAEQYRPSALSSVCIPVYLLLIMLTSLAPSPMESVIDFLLRLMRSTTRAFCRGVTRQHITALHMQPTSSSSFSMFSCKANTYSKTNSAMLPTQQINSVPTQEKENCTPATTPYYDVGLAS